MSAPTRLLDGVAGLVDSSHRSWKRLSEDAVVMRKLNGWLTVFWVLAIPVSYAAGWLQSVTYVSALSLWALVAGHLSTWQAARVEVKQQAEARERDRNPIEERVVDRLVEKTNVTHARGSDEPARFW